MTVQTKANTPRARRARRGLLGAMLVLVLALMLPAASAQAAGKMVGGGTVSGEVNFLAGFEVPKLGDPCEQTSFTFTGQSEASFVLNTVLTGYLGELDISGSGGSPCEGTSSGSGSLQLTASGTGPTGSTISCPPMGSPELSGGYTRALGVVVVNVSGECVINKFATGTVRFLATLEFSPDMGQGISQPVSHATFRGAYTILTV